MLGQISPVGIPRQKFFFEGAPTEQFRFSFQASALILGGHWIKKIMEYTRFDLKTDYDIRV